MNKNIAIRVQNLTKAYKLYGKPIDRLKESLHPLKKKYHKDFYALKDIGFEIKKGEIVGIIGKNGSGKSTLLKIITGVLTPTSGKVSIYGKISAILELGAGFNPEMTGLENIYLNTSINGMNKAQIDKKIDEIVAFAELGEFMHQPIKTYSSGMKARLAFAVSINVEPDILIVDEALSVGDAAFARKCFAKMEEIKTNGATILFVSHSEGSIVSLCNRAVWISNGNQIIDGIPKLVTGLYMKYINENKIDKSKVEKEYEILVNNTKDDAKKETKTEVNRHTNKTQLAIKDQQSSNSIEEFYNPTLKPKSTIYYKEKGAKISDVKITTLDGKEVNVLIQGREYIYSYVVQLFMLQESIHFGMHMKDVKGTILMGSVYPFKDKFISLEPGKYTVYFRFINLFNIPEIFCSAGVRTSKGEFAHRSIDNYIFKNIELSRKNTGLTSMVTEGNIK
ncbi:ABC transporter ATP-binding protein [Campylobacter sp. RM13119]|uniref:ABC transporter ATP-binding protein n=1 Tax=Campylobacter californiensis TaxID=1032243 RepID=UPI001476577B|nr:ABC transporter ATP-binding protein [Campylobacter sp. RM13119]MBE3606332.1 ABC transporter ATP-binding protein [Campylobacter sp. RM13119]